MVGKIQCVMMGSSSFESRGEDAMIDDNVTICNKYDALEGDAFVVVVVVIIHYPPHRYQHSHSNSQ